MAGEGRIRAHTLPLYLPVLIQALCHGILLPILPLFALELGESYMSVGFIVAGEGAGIVLGSYPAGRSVARFGRKSTMIFGSACAAVFTFLLAWVETVSGAVVLQVFIGISLAQFNIACHAYLAEKILLQDRGRAIALYGGIMRFGMLVGPLIGGWIAKVHGIRGPFLVCACAFGLALVIVIIFIRRTPLWASSRPSTRGGSTEGFWLHIGSNLGRYTPAAGTYLVFQGIRSARGIFIPLLGADLLGLEVQAIAMIVSISMVVDLSLFYPAGLIMDRFGRKRAILPCFLIQSIGIALLATVDGYYGLLAVAVLIGLGNGLGSGSMLTLSADLAPHGHRSEFLGFWRVIGEGGKSGTQMIICWCAAGLSLAASSLLVASVGLATVACFARFVPETLRTSHRGASPD